MNKKKIILVLCFIVLILSLNTFYATNDNQTATDIQKQITKSTVKEESNTVYVDANSKTAKEDGSKTSPYKTINDANLEKIASDATIQVSKGTYKINSTNINKNIAIIGENTEQVIFIPTETNSAFTIEKNRTVKFKNFTLKSFTSNSSAAITNDGKLNIECLNLVNNIGTTRTNKGGAIFNTGTLTVTDTTFEGNMASWGAAVYNTGNTTVTNSKFKNNSIYNVGGALYNLRGNMNVSKTRFSGNRAVSGAAIYNAMGNLSVNDTEFYKNDAEKFFGGAIYSTGITIANNSQFYLNHATKDGGAITNTNNFTIINCIFQENSADENGGTIENVPWSNTENGNLTMINSTFIENSAGDKGGVIINYDKEENKGENCTVTARNCIFDSNTAATRGGLIYNQQYMDFQNCIIINNDAQKYRTIYSSDKFIKSIDNNWWGTNKPTKSTLGVMPKTWIIMKFTNKTALATNLTTKLQVTLNTLNNGKKLKSTIPERTLIFTAQNTVFPTNYAKINSTVTTKLKPVDKSITAQIDNQHITLKTAKANITYALTNKNQTLRIKIQLPSNVNGKATVKLGSSTIANNRSLKNGVLTISYNIPTSWSKAQYKMKVLLKTTQNTTFSDNNTIVKIPKRETVTSLKLNTTSLKAGNSIKLTATVKMGGKALNRGYVAFKINNRIIKSKVKIVNSTAAVTYRIPSSFNPNKYNITATYYGDNNKKASKATRTVTIKKQDVHINLKDTLLLTKNRKNTITVKCLDENNKALDSAGAYYRIDSKNSKDNVTLKNGAFTIIYKTPDYKTSKTLTIRVYGNSKYNQLTRKIGLNIK